MKNIIRTVIDNNKTKSQLQSYPRHNYYFFFNHCRISCSLVDEPFPSCSLQWLDISRIKMLFFVKVCNSSKKFHKVWGLFPKSSVKLKYLFLFPLFCFFVCLSVSYIVSISQCLLLLIQLYLLIYSSCFLCFYYYLSCNSKCVIKIQ